MNNSIHSFSHFLKRYVPFKTTSELAEILDYSSVRHLGMVLKTPSTCTNELLLIIANCIEVEPWDLIKDWKLGINKLTTVEMEHYKSVYSFMD